MPASTDRTREVDREKRNRLIPKQAAFVDACIDQTRGKASEADIDHDDDNLDELLRD